MYICRTHRCNGKQRPSPWPQVRLAVVSRNYTHTSTHAPHMHSHMPTCTHTHTYICAYRPARSRKGVISFLLFIINLFCRSLSINIGLLSHTHAHTHTRTLMHTDILVVDKGLSAFSFLILSLFCRSLFINVGLLSLTQVSSGWASRSYAYSATSTWIYVSPPR